MAGLAGFLLAKAAAAYSRRKEKDWYDIAFVLLHNDAGGPAQAAEMTYRRFSNDLGGAMKTALDDLLVNFETVDVQGPSAYVSQASLGHRDVNEAEMRADTVVAVRTFHRRLFGAKGR